MSVAYANTQPAIQKLQSLEWEASATLPPKVEALKMLSAMASENNDAHKN